MSPRRISPKNKLWVGIYPACDPPGKRVYGVFNGNTLIEPMFRRSSALKAIRKGKRR